MPFVCPNLVHETTTSTGTGTISLAGAVTGAVDFDSQLATGDSVPYTIENDTQKEVGIGGFIAPSTLARGTVLYSTNGGSLVNFSAGTKDVYAALPGELVSSLLDQSGADGFMAQIAQNVFARRTLTAELGVSISDGDGIAADPVIRGTHKRIEEFGAEATPGFNNSTAFAAAVTWATAEATPATIVIPAGVYEYNVSPNWAVQGLTVVCHGDVRFRYTGSGNCLILDGGAAGGGVFDVRFGRVYIEGTSSAGHGVYMRAVHHCMLDFNVRGCGTGSAGLKMEWCVLNELRYTVSINEGAFYGGGKPLIGLDIDARSGVDSAYNTFINPIIEGCGTGCVITAGSGNTCVGGAIEACTTLGCSIPLGSNFNKFLGTDFELNGGALSLGTDLSIGGASNQIIACESDSNINIISGGRFNKIIGCTCFNITIDSGSSYNLVANTQYDRIGATYIGAVTDNGLDTIVSNLLKGGNGTTPPGVEPRRGRNVYTADLTSSTETVGASPWTYTNNTGYNVGMLVAGGIVTQLVYKRTAGASVTLGVDGGVFELSPGDGMQITYTTGFPPAVEIYPR